MPTFSHTLSERQLTFHSGETDPMKDMIQVFVTDDSIFSDYFRDNCLYKTRDLVLGAESERTTTIPEWVDGALSGGTAFERSLHRAVPVKKGRRAYPYFGPSFQKPRSMSTPGENSRMPWDNDRKLRAEMYEVSVSPWRMTRTIHSPSNTGIS